MSYLRAMEKAGLISYETTGSSKPFRIVGGALAMDLIPRASLDRLQVSADEATMKLQQVITMHGLRSSAEKHAYLEQFLNK